MGPLSWVTEVAYVCMRCLLDRSRHWQCALCSDRGRFMSRIMVGDRGVLIILIIIIMIMEENLFVYINVICLLDNDCVPYAWSSSC